MAALKVGISGYKEIKANLGPDLWHDSFATLAADMLQIGADAARSAAPHGKTGDTAAGIGVRITSGKYPSGRIVSTAKHGGYPYTNLVEFAPKYHHKGWLIGAVLGAAGRMSAALEKAAKAIEDKWQA